MKIKTSKSDSTVAVVILAGFVMLGCQSFYSGAVTLTKVVDSAARQYAHAYNDGLVSAEVATRVASAYESYRKAAGVAQEALISYKESGDSREFDKALESARSAASGFIDLVVPYLASERVSQLRNQLAKAGKP